MVGILSPEILETASPRAGSLEDSPSLSSLMMIFKETTLASAPGLLVPSGLGGRSRGALAAVEQVGGADEASTDEAFVAISPTEVETDWEQGAAVKSEPVETDEADWCDDEQLNVGCVFPSLTEVAV